MSVMFLSEKSNNSEGQVQNTVWFSLQKSTVYLTKIPRAQMGSEVRAHEAEGRRGYWLRGHEGKRNNYCFSNIQLVGKKKSRQNNFS